MPVARYRALPHSRPHVSPYLLPDGLDLDGALAQHFSVQAEPARESEWTFYDTFDGRLHAAGLTLRHDGGTLALLDRATAKPLARAAQPGAPARLFAADLPAPLRDKLAPLI